MPLVVPQKKLWDPNQNQYLYQDTPSFQPSLDSSSCRALGTRTGDCVFDPCSRQCNSFKNSKILFLNEDTLAIEVCIKLKSQIDAWKSTFPLSREWKSTFPLSRERKSYNPCMYTMLRQQIYMQWHYQLSAICQMRRMWNDANAEKKKEVREKETNFDFMGCAATSGWQPKIVQSED